jgi:LysM repeat protein
MSRARRKPRPGLAHYLAPAAFLAGVTVAVLLVHSGLSHHSTTTTAVPTTASTTHPATTKTTTQPKSGAKRRFYVVQTGDTFGTIAAKSGISVEQLQSLNPGASSNALQVGQKLRIK